MNSIARPQVKSFTVSKLGKINARFFAPFLKYYLCFIAHSFSNK